MLGTVVVTSIGSLGRVAGWMLPRSMRNLCFEYLLVDAYALGAYGYPRAITMNIDIWIKPDRDNAEAVLRAIDS